LSKERHKMDYKLRHKAPPETTTRTSYYKVDTSIDIKGQKMKATVGSNNRIIKRRLLSQLAVLGLFIWLLIIFISGSVNTVASTSAKILNTAALSLAIMPSKVDATHTHTPKSSHIGSDSESVYTSLESQEKNALEVNQLSLQKQRLQSLRMHNVLRNTASPSVQLEYILAASSHSNRDVARPIVALTQTDMNKALVQRWESEFDKR
jgi:hypothetical protein